MMAENKAPWLRTLELDCIQVKKKNWIQGYKELGKVDSLGKGQIRKDIRNDLRYYTSSSMIAFMST